MVKENFLMNKSVHILPTALAAFHCCCVPAVFSPCSLKALKPYLLQPRATISHGGRSRSPRPRLGFSLPLGHGLPPQTGFIDQTTSRVVRRESLKLPGRFCGFCCVGLSLAVSLILPRLCFTLQTRNFDCLSRQNFFFQFTSPILKKKKNCFFKTITTYPALCDRATQRQPTIHTHANT